MPELRFDALTDLAVAELAARRLDEARARLLQALHESEPRGARSFIHQAQRALAELDEAVTSEG